MIGDETGSLGPPWPSYTPTEVADGRVKTCASSSKEELACTTAIE